MSAENDDGKSFLRTLVSWRWCCWELELELVVAEEKPWGLRAMVHASSLRNMVPLPPDAAAVAAAAAEVPVCEVETRL